LGSQRSGSSEEIDRHLAETRQFPHRKYLSPKHFVEPAQPGGFSEVRLLRRQDTRESVKICGEPAVIPGEQFGTNSPGASGFAPTKSFQAGAAAGPPVQLRGQIECRGECRRSPGWGQTEPSFLGRSIDAKRIEFRHPCGQCPVEARHTRIAQKHVHYIRFFRFLVLGPVDLDRRRRHARHPEGIAERPAVLETFLKSGSGNPESMVRKALCGSAVSR